MGRFRDVDPDVCTKNSIELWNIRTRAQRILECCVRCECSQTRARALIARILRTMSPGICRNKVNLQANQLARSISRNARGGRSIERATFLGAGRSELASSRSAVRIYLSSRNVNKKKPQQGKKLSGSGGRDVADARREHAMANWPILMRGRYIN